MNTFDRQALSIDDLTDRSDDIKYWLSKSPQERLLAVEEMRQVIYGYQPAAQRFQRILEVAELASS